MERSDVSSWNDLEEDAQEAEAQAGIKSEADIQKEKADQVDKIFFDVGASPAGKIMFKYLYEKYCETDVARPEDTQIGIGIRQGKATLVRDMFKAIERSKSN